MGTVPMNEKTILVTGGCGFIGSHFVRSWLRNRETAVVNLDLLTYAGNAESLLEVLEDPRHTLVHGDICDQKLVGSLLEKYQPTALVHFAAESHVDRSIAGPAAFLRTNVEGTFHLLEAVRAWWGGLPPEQKENFRFLHISTDEVYGSLGPDDAPFSETTPFSPNSPYSASKAASDHLVRAWHHTYGLPVLTTNCTNNYGPAQFPEKLIPHMILRALDGEKLPVYGKGENIRDWLYVEDHCHGLRLALERGVPGEVYCLGGGMELTNLELVRLLCRELDRLRPRPGGNSHEELISFVPDRPGHDFRYAMDTAHARRELGWEPTTSFSKGLEQTIQWYLENPGWIERVRSGDYRNWIETNYSQRVAR